MKKVGELEIKVIGQVGNSDLSPDNYDIKYVASLLQDVEDLLYPNARKQRPLISYDIQEGSVKHIFKTTLQTIIGFGAILSQIQAKNSIDFLDLKTAQAIENIQNLAIQKNYEFQISVFEGQETKLVISPLTVLFKTKSSWAEAELYFYGIIKDAGGKKTANVHMDTEEYGYVTIEVDQDFLELKEENILYKKFGIRARGRQNIETGEIDTKSLVMIELIDYSANFDDKYLNELIAKAKRNWQGVNTEEWLQNIRGEYEL